jgi:hypothetical protein
MGSERKLGGESLPLGVTADWEYKEYRASAKTGEIFIITNFNRSFLFYWQCRKVCANSGNRFICRFPTLFCGLAA